MAEPTQGNTSTSYTISLLLWGGSSQEPNPSNPDPPGHVALAIHTSLPLQPKTCHLHHARCPSQVRFIYESRPQQPFEADPCPRGRCIIATDLSFAQAQKANTALAAYGEEEENLPWYGEGNCHDWTAGAVSRLERDGLGNKGDGELWQGLVGKGPRGMEKGWKEWRGEEGWVKCDKWEREEGQRKERGQGGSRIDARWGYASGDGDGEGQGKGKVEVEDFQKRVGRMERLLGGGR